MGVFARRVNVKSRLGPGSIWGIQAGLGAVAPHPGSGGQGDGSARCKALEALRQRDPASLAHTPGAQEALQIRVLARLAHVGTDGLDRPSKCRRDVAGMIVVLAHDQQELSGAMRGEAGGGLAQASSPSS